MQGFTKIDLIILVIYLAAVLFAGLHFAKKEMKGKEYFKSDGTVPWWVTSVSIFATLLSPISFLSLAGNSYAGTWIMWFAQLGMLLAIPLTIKFFLPVYSSLGIDTAYHYLELRFQSKGLRVLGAVMFIIYQVGRMSIIMYLPCMVLGNLTGISVNLLIVIMGVIAIIYSYTGGLEIRPVDRFHSGFGSAHRRNLRPGLPARPHRRRSRRNFPGVHRRAQVPRGRPADF